ncbi:MAG TPA: CPBP family intramembrane glutamic endopeptidase [Woeseiaceae bacterium]
MAILRNPFVVAFAFLYVLAATALVTTGVYSLAEPLFMLAILGVTLPTIAYLLCRRIEPLVVRCGGERREILVTFALVVIVVLYLVWGGERIDALVYGVFEKTPRLDFFLTIAKKVLVFVVIPYVVLSTLFGYRWRDFGFVGNLKQAMTPRVLLLMAVFFLLYFAIQFLVGQAAQPVFRGDFPALTVILGGVLIYATLIIEVGLVEEFFFRAVLQTRLAAWLQSEAAGVVMMSLIFGLAHAPGLYLRGAGAVTELGATPGAVSVLAYSIAILSLAGVAFGVIWAMTRNIYALILIHAWVDTLPGLPEFIETFGLGGK